MKTTLWRRGMINAMKGSMTSVATALCRRVWTARRTAAWLQECSHSGARVNMLRAGGKSGAILGMVLVIVVALSLVGMGLLQLAQMNAVEVSRSYNLSKAFWAAEAGLFDARAKLRGPASAYRVIGNSYIPETSLGYSVWLSSADGINFRILSTGEVQGAIRIVQTFIRVQAGWPAAFDYSLFTDGTIKLGQNVSVTCTGGGGDIYADNGFAGGNQIPTTNNCEIYDGVAGGVYGEPIAAHDVPAFDPSYYDDLITPAQYSPNTTYPSALGGGSYEVNKDIIITSPISGSGCLVVYGKVTISSGALIGDGITIIAKDVLSITGSPVLGSNDVFYSATSISIAKENSFSEGNSALITPGGIDIQKTFVFAGLIYAGGDIVMDKFTGSAGITGCVVSGGDLTIKKDLNITYDASQLPDDLLPGFSSDVPPVVTDGTWSQVFQ